ncbi:flagellar biosynthetic protein FliP, partial [Pseudomonas aeruginosa]|nr:flagellar biosynthetic protein FliP [Pseudomonas aeruginosa]MBX6943159.1 flagellar biosynthetic protein FliP [Pseudomonas aeruginosa]
MTPRISLAGALAALCLLLLAPWPALAADPTSISAITVTTNGQGQQEYSVSLQI